MPYPAIAIGLAGLLIILGFYVIRYGVLAGLVERDILKNKWTKERATGRDAIHYGILNIFAGMFLLIIGTYVLAYGFSR